MMCLGWSNRPVCAARDDEQLVPPWESSISLGPGAAGGQTACPDSSWFWLALAGIGVAALVKK
jgi:hypothetical protein